MSHFIMSAYWKRYWINTVEHFEVHGYWFSLFSLTMRLMALRWRSTMMSRPWSESRKRQSSGWKCIEREIWAYSMSILKKYVLYLKCNEQVKKESKRIFQNISNFQEACRKT